MIFPNVPFWDPKCIRKIALEAPGTPITIPGPVSGGPVGPAARRSSACGDAFLLASLGAATSPRFAACAYVARPVGASLPGWPCERSSVHGRKALGMLG